MRSKSSTLVRNYYKVEMIKNTVLPKNFLGEVKTGENAFAVFVSDFICNHGLLENQT